MSEHRKTAAVSELTEEMLVRFFKSTRANQGISNSSVREHDDVVRLLGGGSSRSVIERIKAAFDSMVDSPDLTAAKSALAIDYPRDVNLTQRRNKLLESDDLLPFKSLRHLYEFEDKGFAEVSKILLEDLTASLESTDLTPTDGKGGFFSKDVYSIIEAKDRQIMELMALVREITAASEKITAEVREQSEQNLIIRHELDRHIAANVSIVEESSLPESLKSGYVEAWKGHETSEKFMHLEKIVLREDPQLQA
ncbi:hypothetical protein [Paeniglutamicibacter sp. NPDC091659]|uniref:hypothetical protein n=1 Tax=Paeniglutamicibacter sp. NPDC091659 TaxID=3364389 RepID=UPI00380169F0